MQLSPVLNNKDFRLMSSFRLLITAGLALKLVASIMLGHLLHLPTQRDSENLGQKLLALRHSKFCSDLYDVYILFSPLLFILPIFHERNNNTRSISGDDDEKLSHRVGL